MTATRIAYVGVYNATALYPYAAYVGIWPAGAPKPRLRPLAARAEIVDHRCEGFQWGSAGLGAAQLALAILADALGDPSEAKRLHQRFKWRALVPLAADQGFELSRESVLAVIEDIVGVETDKAVAGEAHRVAVERAPVEHDGGMGVGGGRVTWDTDTAGNRIRERGE